MFSDNIKLIIMKFSMLSVQKCIFKNKLKKDVSMLGDV